VTRGYAGTLGLIGLSVEQTGPAEDDKVVVGLDAWYIGGALEATDSAGLLDGVFPPKH
jgi:hypothetical protein